jgi:hypothetical protein
MALIKISADGAEFEITDDVARDDRHLSEALAPFYPELANAEINRSEEDGKLIVTVTKRAGTKGAGVSDVIIALRAAPEEINPALVLQRRLIRTPISTDGNPLISGGLPAPYGYLETTGRFCNQAIFRFGWSRAASRRIGLSCALISARQSDPAQSRLCRSSPRICDRVVWARRFQSLADVWRVNDSNHWPKQSVSYLDRH